MAQGGQWVGGERRRLVEHIGAHDAAREQQQARAEQMMAHVDQVGTRFRRGRRAAAVKHSMFTSPDHTHVLMLFNTTRAHVVCTRPKITNRAES